MTPSEVAFLGLGFILGAATGAAIVVVLGTRSPRREIRVTVTRDAVPRRSGTLSQHAFVTSASEPARGGPADRRSYDRDAPAPDLAKPSRVPVMVPEVVATGHLPVPRRAPLLPTDRTSVPFVASAAAVAVAPEWVPSMAWVPEATQAAVATAIEAPATEAAASVTPATGTPGEVSPETRPDPPADNLIERILRGEHRALVEVVDRVAGEDGPRRRDWELLLGGFVDTMAEIAVQESVIDFPMGTAFWDTFTVEQCRRIVAALASMGFHYDGRSGWVEHHVPVYRDLSLALADIGEDPRRIRAWPNQSEIAALFAGARPAPDELLAAAGPDYGVGEMRGILGDRAGDLAGLWLAWDEIKPLLFSEPLPAEAAAT